MSIGVTTANATLSIVSTDLGQLNDKVGKLIEVVFERMRSPGEREVASLIQSQPGGAEAALENDDLLEQVLSAQKSKDGKSARRHGGTEAEDKPTTISELKQEVNKDVEQVLAENKHFEQKFEAVRLQVGEIKVTIKHESDRVSQWVDQRQKI